MSSFLGFFRAKDNKIEKKRLEKNKAQEKGL